MNKIVCLMALFFVAFVTMNSETALAQASAGECTIGHGVGGDMRTLSWTETSKIVVIPYGKKGTVWVPDDCKVGDGKWGFQQSLGLISRRTHRTPAYPGTTGGKGIRITLEVGYGKGRVVDKVTILTPARSFVLEVIMAPSLDDAMMVKVVENINNGLNYAIDRSNAAYTASSDANNRSKAALKAAKQAKARTEVGVDLNVSFLASIYNPGKVPGAGAQFNVYGNLKKWNESNVAFRLGGLVRFHSYELTYANSINYLNKDGTSIELDFGLVLQFQWTPKWWVAVDLEAGPILRVTNHWDSIMDMDPKNDLNFVEGRKDTLFGITAGLGLSFFVSHHVGFKIQLIYSGAAHQVVHPGTNPAQFEPWASSVYVTGGLTVKF